MIVNWDKLDLPRDMLACVPAYAAPSSGVIEGHTSSPGVVYIPCN